jgi:hypothetical protein
MTGRLDHAKRRAGDAVRRQGTQAADDLGEIMPMPKRPPKRRPGKVALRQQLAQAEAAITRTVRCPCGHEGSVTIPASKARKRLRCSRCGEYAP